MHPHIPQTCFYQSFNCLFYWSSLFPLWGNTRRLFSWTMSSNVLVQPRLSTLVQWSICNAGGLMLCPLFHMSVPNTFPFTLAVSFCHWGLPHGVDHVSRWGADYSTAALPPFFLFSKKKKKKKRVASEAEYWCFMQVSVCVSHLWQPLPPPYW